MPDRSDTTHHFKARCEEAIEILKEENGRDDLAEERPILLNQLLGLINREPPSPGTIRLKDIVCQYVRQNPGVRNSELGRALGIQSYDRKGRNKNWFSWDILKLLVEDNRIEKREKKYYPVE